MTRLPNGTFWAAPPAPVHTRAEDWEPARMPLALRVLLMIGAAVWCLAIVGAFHLVHGQVEPVVTFHGGALSTMVRNPARDTADVTVELMGARARVSPSAFWLAPGERQAVRVRLREAVLTGTILRLVTCVTPRTASLQGNAAGAVARIYVRTCIAAKAVA